MRKKTQGMILLPKFAKCYRLIFEHLILRVNRKKLEVSDMFYS